MTNIPQTLNEDWEIELVMPINSMFTCIGTFKDSIFSAIFTNLPPSILLQPAIPLLDSTRKTELPLVGFYTKKSLITRTCNYSSTFKSNHKMTERGKKNPLIFNLFAQGVALPWKDGR